jgi:hypothetical protein
MGKDIETFSGRLQFDREGNRLNPIQLEGASGTDVKALAAKLTQINDNATTLGEYYKIGTLYGFNLLVKTKNSKKEGLFMKENKFYVEGEGSVKYTYNNGHIANDPKLAVSYFIHALEKIPSLIDKYQADTEKISKDIPVLREVANSMWRKEEELKELKSELAALDRKIQLSLKPIEQGKDKPRETQDNAVQTIQDLMSGKLNPKVISSSQQERLQEVKEVMDDRLAIASASNHSKNFKL